MTKHARGAVAALVKISVTLLTEVFTVEVILLGPDQVCIHAKIAEQCKKVENSANKTENQRQPGVLSGRGNSSPPNAVMIKLPGASEMAGLVPYRPE